MSFDKTSILQLKKLDMKKISKDSTILVLGRRRSGKSILIRDIMYHHRHIPAGIVFSGTEQVSPFFGKFIPESYIYSEYQPEVVKNLMNKQQIRIDKATIQGTDPKLPNLFIVLDDLTQDANIWKKEDTVKSIFFNGRHYNIFFIFALHYTKDITPNLRNNIDYVFIFHDANENNQRQIHKDYCGMIPDFKTFQNIMESCTENHGCLVVKLAGGSESKLTDQIFWYRADANLPDFKIGSTKMWQYHKQKYNKFHRKESERKQLIYDKTKEKYPNNHTLKVIVDKNDIINDYSSSC